jgi:flagellar basal body rod protein FlgC
LFGNIAARATRAKSPRISSGNNLANARNAASNPRQPHRRSASPAEDAVNKTSRILALTVRCRNPSLILDATSCGQRIGGV